MAAQKTITIVAPNGAKVRTVLSKRYFVVSYHEVEFKYDHKREEFIQFETPQPVATVERRTDSPSAALTKLRKDYRLAVYEIKWDNGVAEAKLLTRSQLESAARGEVVSRKSTYRAYAV